MLRIVGASALLCRWRSRPSINRRHSGGLCSRLGARNLQAAYWRNWLGTFMAQAEELRALSTKVTADTAEPIKAHVTRGMNELHKAS